MPGNSGLRVGFIGSGWTDSTQIPTFRLGGLTPQAIASANPAKARAVAEKHGVPEVYDSWQELVASKNVDIVSVCTPPYLHKEIAVAALQAGKHVICEKPTALNVNEAEEMLAAAQAAPNQLAIVDHELRFHPQRLQMRQMIREGYIGSVLHVHLDRLGSERLNPDLPWNWWCDVDQGGGMLNALGSHLLDLARWIVGRIEALTAQLQIGHLYRTDTDGSVRQVTADDHAQLLLRFANGAQGSITVSGLTPGGWGMSIFVVGTDGVLKLDNQDQLWGMRGAAYPGGRMGGHTPAPCACQHGRAAQPAAIWHRNLFHGANAGHVAADGRSDARRRSFVLRWSRRTAGARCRAHRPSRWGMAQTLTIRRYPPIM